MILYSQLVTDTITYFVSDDNVIFCTKTHRKGGEVRTRDTSLVLITIGLYSYI